MAASVKHVIVTCDQENKIGTFGTIELEKYSIYERVTRIKDTNIIQ